MTQPETGVDLAGSRPSHHFQGVSTVVQHVSAQDFA
jgi:hypothetical protein